MYRCCTDLETGISIHAPARGATGLMPDNPQERLISIHAPARGATRGQVPPFPGPENFNPRSRKGSDFQSQNVGHSTTVFQSTLPQGERPVPAHTLSLPDRDFNPRSRKGSDRNQKVQRSDTRYFNPRSRKGSDVSGILPPRM